MKIRILLFTLFALSLFALGVLITVLFNTSPSSLDALASFYVSLFLTLFGAVFFIGYFLKSVRGTVNGFNDILKIARWATIAALLIVLALIFQAKAILNLATVVVLLVAGVLGELTLRKRSGIDLSRLKPRDGTR